MSVVVRCPTCLTEAAVPDALHGQAVLCPKCQARFTAPDAPPPLPPLRAQLPPPPADRKFCTECGTAVHRKAVICPACGVAQPGATTVNAPPSPAPPPIPGSVPPDTTNRRILAGILGMIFGCFGIHKFVLGYNTEGLVMLLITIVGAPCTHGVGSCIMWIIGMVEGIIYLTKSDADFYRTYIANRKPWF